MRITSVLRIDSLRVVFKGPTSGGVVPGTGDVLTAYPQLGLPGPTPGGVVPETGNVLTASPWRGFQDPTWSTHLM